MIYCEGKYCSRRNQCAYHETFEGIKQYLTDNNIEGIVFWLDGEPKCKIKRSDFGLKYR